MLQMLRDEFEVTDAAWIVYRRDDGTIAARPLNKTTDALWSVAPLEHKVLGRVSGCSARHAIRTAKERFPRD